MLNGTAEERTEVLKALDPDKRTQVLAALPPNVLSYTPEYKEEAEEAQKMRQEEMQQENRRPQPAAERPAESRPVQRREIRRQGPAHGTVRIPGCGQAAPGGLAASPR